MSNAGSSKTFEFYMIARQKSFVRGFKDQRIRRWNSAWYDDQSAFKQSLYEQGRHMAAVAGTRMTRDDLSKFAKNGVATGHVRQAIQEHLSDWNKLWRRPSE